MSQTNLFTHKKPPIPTTSYSYLITFLRVCHPVSELYVCVRTTTKTLGSFSRGHEGTVNPYKNYKWTKERSFCNLVDSHVSSVLSWPKVYKGQITFLYVNFFVTNNLVFMRVPGLNCIFLDELNFKPQTVNDLFTETYLLNYETLNLKEGTIYFNERDWYSLHL